MYSALFLDRDGVIIENRANYVRQWQDVDIYPQALTALARIRHTPTKIILVTNQSVVGRGIIPLAVAEAINHQLVNVITKANGRIDDIFMCPHAPAHNCDCRKPLPGLLHQAAHKHTLNLSQAIMIGDALTDLQAGRAAGVQKTILLKTGRGLAQAQLPQATHLHPFPIYNTLTDALTTLFPNPLP